MREIEEKVGEETDRTLESSKRQLKELEQIAKKAASTATPRAQNFAEGAHFRVSKAANRT